LEERILDLPAARGVEGYLRVHPNFRAIFTSNANEYAGVYRSQDALRDRMITLKLSHYDRDTEIAIATAKSGMSPPDAEKIVDLIRCLRSQDNNGAVPTIRAAIMIGKVMRLSGAQASASDEDFVKCCLDILDSEVDSVDRDKNGDAKAKILDSIKTVC